MRGLLLDTHALFWLVSGEDVLTDDALVAIGENQAAGTLFVSSITAWELSIATQKNRVAGRPHLGEETPARWFRQAVVATEHRDPGDCFLMATARVRKLALVTRDRLLQQIADAEPDYLNTVSC